MLIFHLFVLFTLRDDEVRDWIIDFDLDEKIELIGKITESRSVKFKISANFITGFNLLVKNTKMKAAEHNGLEKAKNIKNILTIKSGMPLKINLRGIQSVPISGKMGFGFGNFMINLGGVKGGIAMLDINEANIQKVINSSGSQSLKYEIVSKAIFYYYHRYPIDCIKELFRLIEDDCNFPNYYKYKIIRNLFSHNLPYYEETIELFNLHFNPNPFDCNIFDPDKKVIILDLDSNKTMSIMYKLAGDFITDIKKNLKLN